MYCREEFAPGVRGRWRYCSDICRFNDKIDKTKGECWHWTGHRQPRGYGILWFDGNKTHLAHRAAYKLFRGSLRDDQLVCHTCDNPYCVNPLHLFLGNHKANHEDMRIKGRMVTSKACKGERHGLAKLADSDIPKIRQRLVDNASAIKIAEEFGVSQSTILKIKRKSNWTHVPEDP